MAGLISYVNLGFGAVSLIFIILTYLRTKRVKPNELEDMVERRVAGVRTLGDTTMQVHLIRFEPAEQSRMSSLMNLVRRYPMGRMVVELHFERRGLEDPPFTAEEFEEVCDEQGVDAEYYLKGGSDLDHPSKHYVDLAINSTRPGDVMDFVHSLSEVVSGEPKSETAARAD